MLRRLGQSQALRDLLLPLVTRLVSAPTWTIRRGPARGLRIRTGGSNPAYALGLSEPELQQALVDHVRPGSVVYDIGANVGFFTLIVARLAGPGGHVYAFEPHPETRRVLQANVARNAFEARVTVMPQAATDHSGSAMLATPSSLDAHLAPDGDVRVEACALDDLGLPPANVVKVDVEGEEAKTLAGMRRTLQRHKPTLAVELHDEEAERGCRELLAELGYEIQPLPGGGMAHIVAV